VPRRGLGAITNGSPASRELATETPSWSPVGAVGAHGAERERRARARILRSAPICSLVRNAGSFFPFAKCRAGVYCTACTWVIDPLIGSHHGDATAAPSASYFPPAAPAARLTTPEPTPLRQRAEQVIKPGRICFRRAPARPDTAGAASSGDTVSVIRSPGHGSSLSVGMVSSWSTRVQPAA
jgi:hypothetical protein